MWANGELHRGTGNGNGYPATVHEAYTIARNTLTKASASQAKDTKMVLAMEARENARRMLDRVFEHKATLT